MSPSESVNTMPAKPTPAEHPPLLRIMYTSVMQRRMDEHDIKALLDTSIANNERDNITGVLMLAGTLCIQYIEGPETPMQALWERVNQDERHHLVVQLYEERGVLQRLFGQWRMLRGQSSRSEMLGLIRNAYLQSEAVPRPAWSLGISPLLILLDPKYSSAYAKAL